MVGEQMVHQRKSTLLHLQGHLIALVLTKVRDFILFFVDQAKENGYTVSYMATCIRVQFSLESTLETIEKGDFKKRVFMNGINSLTDLKFEKERFK